MLKPDNTGLIIAYGKDLPEAYGLRASGKALEVAGYKCPNRGQVIELKLKDFTPEKEPKSEVIKPKKFKKKEKKNDD